MIATVPPLPEDTQRLLVAYSGGRDSTALLHALAGGPGKPPIALHVCHHLDAAAERWAEHCAAFAGALGLVFVRLDVTVDVAAGGLEAAARQARYAALESFLVPGDVVATAHHARDQAETVLLQALRGAGMRGLSAMPPLAPLGAGRLWRPWRDVCDGAIAHYAMEHGLAYVEDPSNDDPARDRAWLAGSIWPALTARRPGVARALARVGERAAEAAAAIEALAEIDQCTVEGQDQTLAIAGLATLPRPRASEVLRRWLGARGNARPDHRHIAQCLALLGVREHGSPRVVFDGVEVRRFDRRLFVMPALGPPPADVLPWREPASLVLPGDSGRLALASSPTAPRGWPAALSVSFRRGGERITRADGAAVALKDWLREHRVPPWIRARLPLVYAGDTLIAVADRWYCADWADYFGGANPRLAWDHELVGDPLRVVASRTIG